MWLDGDRSSRERHRAVDFAGMINNYPLLILAVDTA